MSVRFLVPGLMLVIMALGWGGCNIVKPVDSTIPTYIHIDSFNFKTTEAKYGSSSHAINSIWVYYNDGSVGEFDLPATFPVIANGAGVLGIAPAVAVDGRNDNEGIYPLYTIDTNSFVASPGNTITIAPVTQYIPNIDVRMNADFEVINTFKGFGGMTADTMVRTTDKDKVFEGNGAGYIYLDKPGDSSISISDTFSLTTGASASAFCEFNYKSSMPFYIGMQASLSNGYISSPYYLIGVNSKDTWQKFYVNLENFVVSYPADAYRLVIKANLPASQASGYVLFDNIKILNY